MMTLSAAAEVSGSNRLDYIYGDNNQSTAEWWLFVMLYANAFLGGLVTRLGTRKIDYILGGFSLLLMSYVGTLYGSRMGVLFGGGFWLSSFIAAQVMAGGTLRLNDSRFLLKIGIYSFSIIVGLSIATMAVRYQNIDDGRSIQRHMAETFVFVPAFCLWFKADGLYVDELLWGYRMFWKAYECIGIQREIEHSILVEQTSSNIFTVFRGLIEDFGLVGSCLFLGFFGMFGNYSYRRVMEGQVLYLPALSLVFAYTLIGTSFSLFSYNAPNVSIALFCLFIWFRRNRIDGKICQ
jgi:hypothetical protein